MFSFKILFFWEWREGNTEHTLTWTDRHHLPVHEWKEENQQTLVPEPYKMASWSIIVAKLALSKTMAPWGPYLLKKKKKLETNDD